MHGQQNIKTKYLNIIKADFVFQGFSTQLYLVWENRTTIVHIQLRHY